MPPGSEAFVTALLNTVLSQYGALVSVLFIAIWYLTKQLAEERKNHAETTEKLITLTAKSSEGSNATAQALNSLRSIVERIAYDRSGGNDRGNKSYGQ